MNKIDQVNSMSRLTKEQILKALQALSDEVRGRGRTYELVIVGGAALVEPHLVPGRELKAHYAFDDLWEVLYGDS